MRQPIGRAWARQQLAGTGRPAVAARSSAPAAERRLRRWNCRRLPGARPAISTRIGGGRHVEQSVGLHGGCWRSGSSPVKLQPDLEERLVVRYSLRAGQGRLGGARHPGRCGPEAPGAAGRGLQRGAQVEAAGCGPWTRLRGTQSIPEGVRFAELRQAPRHLHVPSRWPPGPSRPARAVSIMIPISRYLTSESS